MVGEDIILEPVKNDFLEEKKKKEQEEIEKKRKEELEKKKQEELERKEKEFAEKTNKEKVLHILDSIYSNARARKYGKIYSAVESAKKLIEEM